MSVCISSYIENGQRDIEISTDPGRDNDFIVKSYPQFVIETKFGKKLQGHIWMPS